MKKLITYLYNKYCKSQEIETIYLKNIQRNFNRILSESEVEQKNIEVYNFLNTGWFDQIMDEELKEYVEALFNVCETQKQRDYVGYAIKILTKFELRFKSYGTQPQGKVEFDKFELKNNQ